MYFDEKIYDLKREHKQNHKEFVRLVNEYIRLAAQKFNKKLDESKKRKIVEVLDYNLHSFDVDADFDESLETCIKDPDFDKSTNPLPHFGGRKGKYFVLKKPLLEACEPGKEKEYCRAIQDVTMGRALNELFKTLSIEAQKRCLRECHLRKINFYKQKIKRNVDKKDICLQKINCLKKSAVHFLGITEKTFSSYRSKSKLTDSCLKLNDSSIKNCNCFRIDKSQNLELLLTDEEETFCPVILNMVKSLSKLERKNFFVKSALKNYRKDMSFYKEIIRYEQKFEKESNEREKFTDVSHDLIDEKTKYIKNLIKLKNETLNNYKSAYSAEKRRKYIDFDKKFINEGERIIKDFCKATEHVLG